MAARFGRQDCLYQVRREGSIQQRARPTSRCEPAGIDGDGVVDSQVQERDWGESSGVKRSAIPRRVQQRKFAYGGDGWHTTTVQRSCDRKGLRRVGEHRRRKPDAHSVRRRSSQNTRIEYQPARPRVANPHPRSHPCRALRYSLSPLSDLSEAISASMSKPPPPSAPPPAPYPPASRMPPVMAPPPPRRTTNAAHAQGTVSAARHGGGGGSKNQEKINRLLQEMKHLRKITESLRKGTPPFTKRKGLGARLN